MEGDLDQIRTLFLQMCVRAESMVRLAVRSVARRDPHLARSVVSADRELDRLEVEVDRACLQCLALRHPDGEHLRMVTTVMKMVTDVERLGDLAVNVAERGLDLAGPGIEPTQELLKMGEIAADMVRAAADGFVDRNVSVLLELRARDRELDALNRAAFERGLRAMANYPDQVDRSLALTSISKHLERMGDHAVNLGEMVVFLVDGRDIRHRNMEG